MIDNPLSEKLYVENNPLIFSDPTCHMMTRGADSIGSDGGINSVPKATWVKAGEGVYSAVDWYTGGALTNYINSNDQPWSAEHLLNAANLAINFIPISAAEAKALQIGKAAEKAGVSLIQKAGQWIKVVFKGEAKVSAISVSESKMFLLGDHFTKWGRAMGYESKKAYDAAAKEFATINQMNSKATILEGVWNGRGSLNGMRQRAIIFDGKTAVLDVASGQVVDFYVGTEYKGINIVKLR